MDIETSAKMLVEQFPADEFADWIDNGKAAEMIAQLVREAVDDANNKSRQIGIMAVNEALRACGFGDLRTATALYDEEVERMETHWSLVGGPSKNRGASGDALKLTGER